MAIKKQCEHCGKEFAIPPCRKDRARFCSITCKARSQEDKVLRVCETCKDEFYATRGQIRHSGARFCSRQCRDRANRNRFECTCEQCGKRFWNTKSKIDQGKGRFCSVSCFNIWRSLNDARGPESPFWKQTLRTCRVCGMQFFIKAYRSQGQEDFYCSPKCWGKMHANELNGNHNPNWRGGLSFLPYSPGFNEQFRQKIRERDGHQCAICYLPAKCVHHINYNKNDTRDDNCLLLCRSCHSKTNHRRNYWKRELSNLLVARQLFQEGLANGMGDWGF